VDYDVVAFILVFVLFAAVHASLLDSIRKSAPQLASQLGWFGPGYWIGIFWFRPVFRRFLRNGRFDAELAAHPRLLLLARMELALWWLSLIALAVAIAF